MPHTFRTIVLVLVLVLTATAGVVAGATPSDDSPAQRTRTTTPQPAKPQAQPQAIGPAVPIATLRPDQQALVDWAMERFAQAGLELPELTVQFDPTRELCRHHEGRYQRTPAGESVVTICVPDAETFAAQLDIRRTLLHEFAHAWDYANLSDEDHEELGEILGVDAWAAHDAAWEDLGAERFAETFVFALLDQPRRVLKVSLDCTVLLDAFRTGTGADPLGPGLPSCAI